MLCQAVLGGKMNISHDGYLKKLQLMLKGLMFASEVLSACECKQEDAAGGSGRLPGTTPKLK